VHVHTQTSLVSLDAFWLDLVHVCLFCLRGYSMLGWRGRRARELHGKQSREGSVVEDGENNYDYRQVCTRFLWLTAGKCQTFVYRTHEKEKNEFPCRLYRTIPRRGQISSVVVRCVRCTYIVARTGSLTCTHSTCAQNVERTGNCRGALSKPVREKKKPLFEYFPKGSRHNQQHVGRETRLRRSVPRDLSSSV